MNTPTKLRKAEQLKAWRALPENAPMLKHMSPIPYKTRGSRYGACGIRIDGNPQFIDGVLSRLKELIDGENHVTRLELARHIVDGSGINKDLPNADENAEVCYVRLHMRGREGSMASFIFDKHLSAPTQRFEDALA